MNTKKVSKPKETGRDSKPKNKLLDQLKENINKRYEDIEHNFYLIGLDLIKVNMHVKNFRKWVKENTQIGVSTAYTLMRMVKKEKELTNSKKYKAVRPKISFYKLTKLLKYPADFIDNLDFEKEYEVPGGKKFNLIDMPRELFSEVIANENKKLKAKDTDEDEEENDDNMPMNSALISKAKTKLDKLLSELQSVFTVLSEIEVSKDSKDSIKDAIEELESINSQAESINSVVTKLLGTLKKPVRKKKAA